MKSSIAPSAEATDINRASADEAVIFLHLPKTAGTTLNRLIEWEYPLLQMYSIDPVLFEWSSAHLRKLSPRRLQRTRMFKGHMLFGLHEVLPQPATYITVLREPVDRVISAFYFMRSYKLHPLYWKFRRGNWTIDDFVRWSRRDNVQSKIIAGADYEEPCTAEISEKAKDNLRRHFAVVGLSERFEESLALMKLRFGWQFNTYSSFNVTRSRPKKHDLAKSTLDLIIENNSYDIELYECARTIFESAVARNATEVKRIAAELEGARSRPQDSLNSTMFSIRSATRKAISRAYSSI
ncbi:MAG: sulfotransferase family 2 domain-containing protein [Chthoniobacterales bacterium]|nr:sulfotransferase family 2 domain-containing protein [Chthoniobacterales bacterium]